MKSSKKKINAAGEILVRPNDRAEYDRQNPHLKFFLVQTAAAPMFTEKADRLHVLYRVTKDFLAEKEIEVPPLSDMERFDFTADETPMPLLDKLLQ